MAILEARSFARMRNAVPRSGISIGQVYSVDARNGSLLYVAFGVKGLYTDDAGILYPQEQGRRGLVIDL